MSAIKVKVGGSAAADGSAFVDAWRRIERGDAREDHVLSFQSWEGLARIMTPERLRLLRHLYRHPEPSVMALSKSLERQYRRVHEDVAILARNGLVEREGGALHAAVDRIEAMIELT